MNDITTDAQRRFVVLSGCSGGGKSTLLDELARRGLGAMPEPGRQIVMEQNALGRPAFYRSDVRAFVELVISRAMHFHDSAPAGARFVFFDRSIIDAVSALERLSIPVPDHLRAAARLYRYHPTVFLTPPWPEIFVQDAERTHGLAEAVAEYEFLLRSYPRYGYQPVVIPKTSVAERADFVLRSLSA